MTSLQWFFVSGAASCLALALFIRARMIEVEQHKSDARKKHTARTIAAFDNREHKVQHGPRAAGFKGDARRVS